MSVSAAHEPNFDLDNLFWHDLYIESETAVSLVSLFVPMEACETPVFIAFRVWFSTFVPHAMRHVSGLQTV